MSLLYSDSPPARPFSEIKPTLLISWWITLLCTVIILLRLVGRLIRIEKLFLEDKIAALAIIPLYARAACTHIALTYGTNNVQLVGLISSDEEIARRVTGSHMVLASRVFHAATLWTLKLATVLFFRRLAGSTRHKTYKFMLNGLYVIVAATFLATIVSGLAECQSFPHYWQVLPDPGGRCRQAFVQLVTMGVCNTITDLILVVFPVPIILSTKLPVWRKVVLILLFCYGFLAVGVTIYSVPAIIDAHGEQLVRSMWASIHLLCATSVANFIVLGSFLRDNGVKKQKFKSEMSDSGSRPKPRRAPNTGRPGHESRGDIRSDFIPDDDIKAASQPIKGLQSRDKSGWNRSEDSLISQKRPIPAQAP